MTDITKTAFGIALILFAIFPLSAVHFYERRENVWTALFAMAGLIFAIAGIDGSVAQTKNLLRERTNRLDEQPKE